MKLALSSDAAPELGGHDLLEACARRGLRAVELVAGHAHGIAPGAAPATLARLRAACREAGVEVVAVRLSALEAAAAHGAASLSAALRAPVVVAPPDDAVRRDVLRLITRRYRGAGSAWLGRRGGWGCGSVRQDEGLVRLGPRDGGGRERWTEDRS